MCIRYFLKINGLTGNHTEVGVVLITLALVALRCSVRRIFLRYCTCLGGGETDIDAARTNGHASSNEQTKRLQNRGTHGIYAWWRLGTVG